MSLRITKNHCVVAIPYVVILLIYTIAIIPGPGLPLPNSGHDDGLFFRWSTTWLAGDWLGPWNHLATTKGPLHSILSAIAFRAGLNVFAYKRLFYLIGSSVFTLTALRFTRHWFRILVLATLLTDPFLFGEGGLRNLREGTYIPIQLVAFGLGIYNLDTFKQTLKITKSFIFSAIGMGLAFGLLLITREARDIVRIEILLWFICLLLISFYNLSSYKNILFSTFLAGIIVFNVTMVPIKALSLINQNVYGVSISNSIEEGSFPKLYGRLVSVTLNGETSKPMVPITQKTIDALINVSNNHGGRLALILKTLDQGWKLSNCTSAPAQCNEYQGAWFMWALRDSIYLTLSPPKSELNFQESARLAHAELSEICSSSHRFKCNLFANGYRIPTERWGFKNPIDKFVREFFSFVAYTFLPSPFPQGKVDIYWVNQKPPNQFKELELDPMGTRPISIPESFTWTKSMLLASYLGFVLKSMLIIIAFFSCCHCNLYQLQWRSFDIPSLWLLGSLLLHLSVYTVISLTSFPASLYVTMASPLYIGLLGRISSIKYIAT